MKLEPYEHWKLTPDYHLKSVSGGFVGHFTTDAMIHRRHTKQGLFTAHKVYAAVWFSIKPSAKLLRDHYLPKFRESCLRTLNTGDYTKEELINGVWQNTLARYNQWVFYDKDKQKIIGEVHKI